MTSDLNLPKISIITPVKNSVGSLEKAIKSLLDQNYPNLEYIVIDGSSTDGTLDIIKKYRNHISHFESEDDNSNVVAYIKGIKRATGEIIGLFNADDFYEKETLKKVGETFRDNPDLDAVSLRFRVIKNEKIIEETRAQDAILERDSVIQIFGANTRFLKKDLFYKYGFPLTTDDVGRVLISNDLEYLIRFTLKGIKNKIIDYVGYNYVSHDNSLTFSNNIKNRIRLYEDRIFIAKKFLNSSEFDLPKIWKKTFKRWIKKYRAMIAIKYLKQKEWGLGSKNFALGAKESGFFKFIFYCIKTLLRSRREKKVGF